MDAAAAITFLFVSDLANSDRFYRRVLGLDLVVDQGDCRIYRITGSSYLGLCERPEQLAAKGLILTFVIDDVEATHEDLVEAGITVESPPAHSDAYGIVHAFYRDPDGHLIEVQRFDEPDWAEVDG